MTPASVAPPAGIPPARVARGGSIVLRVPNWIGDAVLALPAVAAIAEHFPDRAILAVGRAHIVPLFAGQAGLAGVVVIAGRGAARFASVRRGLGGRRPALGVAFPHSLGSALELVAAGTGEIWGYGGSFRRAVLGVALPRRWLQGRHRWESCALLAAAVTGRPVAERYPVPAAPEDVSAADRLFADPRLAGDAPIVGMVPGAHASSRRWPASRFAEVAARLGQDGARVILFGSAADGPLTAAIAGAARPVPLDWAGRTPLRVLAECFRRLDFLLTNDTGPMHLAAAVGTPLLDLCGAADERATGPRGPASEVIVHPVYCRPCVKNTCAYNLECMTGISVAAVIRQIEARLGEAL